jgi:hypothetical protein
MPEMSVTITGIRRKRHTKAGEHGEIERLIREIEKRQKR